MMVWKMIFLFQGCLVRFHVNLPGCTSMAGFLLKKNTMLGRKNHPKFSPGHGPCQWWPFVNQGGVGGGKGVWGLAVWERDPYLHPGRLTWNIIMEVWKMNFPFFFMGDGCRFHVNLPGCSWPEFFWPEYCMFPKMQQLRVFYTYLFSIQGVPRKHRNL